MFRDLMDQLQWEHDYGSCLERNCLEGSDPEKKGREKNRLERSQDPMNLGEKKT
jgi:hypothetical protein